MSGIKSQSELKNLNPPPSELVDELKARYEIDDKWRSAWNRLANKNDPGGRLQTKQERIERRAVISESRIFNLLRQYDDACSA